MTIERLKQLYPATVERIHKQGFDAGVQAAQEQWEAKILTEDETGEVLDDVFREAFR